VSLLQSRRRLITSQGRTMRLRRPQATSPLTYADVTLTGFLALYAPGDLTGGVITGDARLAVLGDEMAAATWPAPPRAQDIAVIDGRSWIVVGAMALFEGPHCIGYDLHVRAA
jgi:hypothetical protein